MGSALRSLAFALVQSIVTPLYALAVFALAWLPPVRRYRFITGWCALNLWAARRLCGVRHRVIGLEHVPASAHIVACKHSSTWETLFLSRLLPPLAYVAKKELLSLPFFGWAFALASPITIDRAAGENAMVQIADQGRKRIAQGFWIAFYPEGPRIPAGKRVHY
jgi:1-acyl-sn-glycerol-3-phosphate acyltransferase